MTISVAVADDEALIRSGVAMILATAPDIDVVGQARDGFEAVDLVRRLRPNVVLMDIQMPGMDGLAATRIIAQEPNYTATRIVMLTTYDLDEYLFGALQAGAAGFLLKGDEPEVLIRGVRATAAGESLLAPKATRRLITEFVESRRRSETDPDARRRVATLTPRETEVLALMAEGRSNGEIAAELIVGENTVKTHVSHVLDKLGARDRVHAVIIAYAADLADSQRPGGQRDNRRSHSTLRRVQERNPRR